MNQALGLAGTRGSHSVPDSLLCLGPVLTLALSMSLAKMVPVTEADATFTASTAQRASSVSSQLETPERECTFSVVPVLSRVRLTGSAWPRAHTSP